MSIAIPYSEDIFTGLYDLEESPSHLGERVERVELVEALRASRSYMVSLPLITFNELQSVWKARQKKGWDGYSALPIKRASRDDAFEFLRQLPSELIQPDVVPESDGTIALEWQRGDSVFVVSFQGSGKLIFAGDFDNGRRTRGHENLAKGVPQTIAAILGTEFISD